MFPHQKRVVWQERLQLKLKPQPPQLCETRVAGVWHSIYLRLLIESLSNALYKIKLQVQEAELKPLGLLLVHMKHYYPCILL